MLNQQDKEFVERNHNLIYFFCNKHNLNITDWYDILAISLCESALKYNPAKAKESTFVMLRFWKTYCYELRSKSQHKRIANEKPLEFKEELMMPSYELEDKMSTDCLLDVLPEPNRTVMDLVSQGYKPREIASQLNIPNKKVYLIVQQSKLILRKFLKEEFGYEPVYFG